MNREKKERVPCKLHACACVCVYVCLSSSSSSSLELFHFLYDHDHEYMRIGIGIVFFSFTFRSHYYVWMSECVCSLSGRYVRTGLRSGYALAYSIEIINKDLLRNTD